MLDIKFLRENPDIVKENIKKKFQDSKIPMVDEAIELDKALNKYINDIYFRKELQSRFKYYEIVTTTNIVNSLVDNIINVYENYKEGTTRSIYVAKWI